jgi:signal transduction histidine kinase
MRDARGFVGGGEDLGPLLERLAFLESTNSGLKGDLDDTAFRAEIQTMALREQLQSAQLEVSRQQEILDNFCRETLAAVRARDEAKAQAQAALTQSQEAVERLKAELTAELDAALKDKSDAAHLVEKTLLEKEVALQVLATVRLQAEADRRAKDDADARVRRMDETLSSREALYAKTAEDDRRTLAAMAAQLEFERQQADEARREARRVQGQVEETALTFAAPSAPVPAASEIPAAQPPVTPAPASTPAAASQEPAWDKILPTLRRPVSAAFARLRQLPLAAIPEGPRAMIRMAAVSLTQASDMLKALEEFFREPAEEPAPGRAETSIEAVLAAWEAPFKQRRITFVRRFEPSLPHVLMRDESLRVAVFQVLRNAYEALPRGGSVTVHVSHEGDGVKARFSDSGKGFSSEALTALFVPFSAARPGHLGLGLALARKLLRGCGGDLEAANAPVKGAVVTVHLAAHGA